jgi:hypothetical protein
MVLVEARVLCGDYGVLEISRNLVERNEFVTFAIRRVVNPSDICPLPDMSRFVCFRGAGNNLLV